MPDKVRNAYGYVAFFPCHLGVRLFLLHPSLPLRTLVIRPHLGLPVRTVLMGLGGSMVRTRRYGDVEWA